MSTYARPKDPIRLTRALLLTVPCSLLTVPCSKIQLVSGRRSNQGIPFMIGKGWEISMGWGKIMISVKYDHPPVRESQTLENTNNCGAQ